MPLITCHSGKIQTVLRQQIGRSAEKSFVTGLHEIDSMAPANAFARGAIHELLSNPKSPVPLTFALLLARSASHSTNNKTHAPIIWCDSDRRLYPPALATRGIDLKRVFILRAPISRPHSTKAHG